LPRIVLILVFACALSARAAEGDERVRPNFGLDLGFVGGVEPLHGGLPDDVAFLYGGDLRLRLAFVSLGLRLEKSSEFSVRNTTFTRWLGTLGFNIGLGDKTELSPYLGFGKLAYSGAIHPDELDARLGIELEHFFVRYLSAGAGIAFDARLYDLDGVHTAGSLSFVLRLAVHLPFG